MRQNIPSATDRGNLVIALALALGLINYLDRVVISFAVAPIRREFGIDDASFGLAMSLFAAGALAINGLAGVLLDRWGARVVWAGGLLLWSITMFTLGLLEHWWVFLALRVLLGIGEGVNFPAMNRAIADWVPRERSTMATSLALLGVPVALLVGGPLFGETIARWGWRWTFMALGIAGGSLFLLWSILYRDPPRDTSGPRAKSAGWTQLLRDPTLLATSWSFFGFGAVLFFGVTWIPGYFESSFGLDLLSIGWFTTLPWGISILGMIAVGFVSDRIYASTGDVRRARIHPIWILQSLAAACFLPLAFVDSSSWAIFWLTLGIAFSMSSNGPYYAVCTDLFEEEAGSATGVMVTFFSASGVITPVMIGWLSDVTTSFAAGFLMLAAIVSSGALALLLLARPALSRPTGTDTI